MPYKYKDGFVFNTDTMNINEIMYDKKFIFKKQFSHFACPPGFVPIYNSD